MTSMLPPSVPPSLRPGLPGPSGVRGIQWLADTDEEAAGGEQTVDRRSGCYYVVIHIPTGLT
jgi:hypothetical protein